MAKSKFSKDKKPAARKEVPKKATVKKAGGKKASAKKTKSSADGKARWNDRDSLRLGFVIHDVSRLRRAYYDRHLKQFDLTRSQWWVMVQLARLRGAYVTQTELAQRLEIKKASIGGLLARLEANGLIKRVDSDEDRRRKYPVLTGKGQKALDAVAEVGVDFSDRILDGISKKECAIMLASLAKMKKNVVAQMEEDQAAG